MVSIAFIAAHFFLAAIHPPLPAAVDQRVSIAFIAAHFFLPWRILALGFQ
jgi:hypothetical protein